MEIVMSERPNSAAAGDGPWADNQNFIGGDTHGALLARARALAFDTDGTFTVTSGATACTRAKVFTEPGTKTGPHLRGPVGMWDVWSRSPESLYTVTILFSGEGLPPIGVRPYRQVANDDYTPARAMFALLDGAQRQRLYDNIAAAMVGVPDFIIERQVAEFGRVDPAYGAGVLAAVMRGRQKRDVLF